MQSDWPDHSVPSLSTLQQCMQSLLDFHSALPSIAFGHAQGCRVDGVPSQSRTADARHGVPDVPQALARMILTDQATSRMRFPGIAHAKARSGLRQIGIRTVISTGRRSSEQRSFRCVRATVSIFHEDRFRSIKPPCKLPDDSPRVANDRGTCGNIAITTDNKRGRTGSARQEIWPCQRHLTRQ
jgi:hypothetical protein